MNLEELAAAVNVPRRILIGIAGPPGGGKTTLARALCDATGFAHAPGDGFIIPESYTDTDGTHHDRGTVSGFDTAAYAALLRALIQNHQVADVSVPNYLHTQDGTGADAWVVPAGTCGVITECNFLGSAAHGWPEVRAHIATLVHLEETWEVCRPRLMERQLAKGRTPDQAAARVDAHDRQNFDEATRAAAGADLMVAADSVIS